MEKRISEVIGLDTVIEDISNMNIQDMTVEEVQQKVHNKASILYDYLQQQLPSIVGFGMRVVMAIIVFFVVRRMIGWILRVMKKSMEKASLDEGVIQFVCSISRIILYMLLVFNIAISFGVEESSVAALLGTAGVAIGLGLQGGLANVAGGIMLLLFKPFQVGDYIVQDQAGGCEGTVARIDIYYTTLLSFDNKNVVIPNGTLANSTVTNVTARDHRKLDIKVAVSYDSDIKEVKGILEKILQEDPDAKADNEMIVYVDELADSGVIMGLRVWVATEVYWSAKWRINERIKEEFDANGIVIPYNQMDVHVYQGQKNL